MLTLPITGSVEDSLEQHFSIDEIDFTCQRCSEVEGHDIQFINKLPQVLVINFEIFPTSFVSLATKMKIPQNLDMFDYLSADMMREKETESKYELFGLVNCQGKSMLDSEYSSIVSRVDKET